MPRACLIRTADRAYHITIRSNNREWFYIPAAASWRVFSKRIVQSIERYQVELHAFVMMANHLHMIVSTPQKNIDQMMRYFLTEACRDIRRQSTRINHVFGTRYKWSLLSGGCALAFGLKYLARNPVRAGVVARVEQYPYSSSSSIPASGSVLPIVEGFSDYWR